MRIELLLNITRALADRNRMRLVLALGRYDELCACQLIELLGVTGATTSRHLTILVNAGLVEARKHGRWVYYRLHPATAVDSRGPGRMIAWLRDELAADPSVLRDRDVLERIVTVDPRRLCRKQRGELDCCAELDDHRRRSDIIHSRD